MEAAFGRRRLGEKSDPPSSGAPEERREDIRHRRRERRRVLRVGARHDGERARCFVHGARQGARLVEGRREGDEPVARDTAIRRFPAHETAKGGRLPHGAARVGADRQGHGARGDRRGGSSRRPARHPRRIPGVPHRAVGRVLVRGAHAELVAVGLADDDRARVHQARDARRVIGRHETREDLRARGRRAARDVDVVLHGERNARERQPLARAHAPVDSIGLEERVLGVRRQKGPERFLRLPGAPKGLFRDRSRRDAAGADGVRKRGERSLEKLGRGSFDHPFSPS